MASLSPTPKMQFFDANGKLYTYAAGTTTPLATYTSSAGTISNSNPIILDSRGEAEVWLAYSAYKFKLTTSADVELWTVDNISSGETFGTSQWLTGISGTNTITATLSASNFTAYAEGQTFSFAAANTNTGAVTLNINSLGAKPVTKTGSTALIANDILAGQVVTVVYDGTRFQVVNKSNLASPGPIGSTTASTGAFTTLNATTLTTSGAITAYSVTATNNFTTTNNMRGGSIRASIDMGYSGGTGGAITQTTSRTTAVTLNTICGRITLFNATATAGSVTTFTVNNTYVPGTANAVVILSMANSGASTGNYIPYVSQVDTSSFRISLYCITAPAAAEAPIINFAVFYLDSY